MLLPTTVLGENCSLKSYKHFELHIKQLIEIFMCCQCWKSYCNFK